MLIPIEDKPRTQFTPRLRLQTPTLLTAWISLTLSRSTCSEIQSSSWRRSRHDHYILQLTVTVYMYSCFTDCSVYSCFTECSVYSCFTECSVYSCFTECSVYSCFTECSVAHRLILSKYCVSGQPLPLILWVGANSTHSQAPLIDAVHNIMPRISYQLSTYM